MIRFKINRFRVETMGRVFGTKAFVLALDDVVPEAHLRARDRLRVWAEENGLDAGEYFSELQDVDEEYGRWVPRLAAYAAVTALHTLVESELFECADQLAARSTPPMNRGRRRGLERACSYLRRVAQVDVSRDEVWSDLLRLEELRNLVVHRGGTIERSDKDRKLVENLQRAYPDDLWVVKSSQFRGAFVHVAPSFCVKLASYGEGFFKRLALQLDV